MKPGYISLAEARAAQATALQQAAPRIAGNVTAEAAALTGPGPVFLGIGASYAAASAAVWTLRQRGIAATRLVAGDHPLPFAVDAQPLLVISQSGRSSEPLAALESVAAGQRMALVNVSRSPIAERASSVFSLGDIPDSYASTIGYTATVMALGMLAEAWQGGEIDAGWADLHAAVSALEAELATLGPRIAALLRDVGYVDCVAHAPSAGSAEVGALLLREVARLPATGMSTRQYLHGAMESASGGGHIVFGGARELQLATTLAEAGNRVVYAGPLEPPAHDRLIHVAMPARSAAQLPVLEAIVMQTIAVDTALARGLDPDAFVFDHADTKVAQP